ncbi:MAG: hypothetical protein ACKOUR_17260 [Planctomycetota bacterium]
MVWTRRVSCRLVVLILGFLVTTGCGESVPKGVILKGKVLKGGQPLAVTRPEVGVGWVQIDLIPDGKSDYTETTRAKPDGSFEFPGEGKGIPPGKYKVAVKHYENGPPNDMLQGAFAWDKTKFTVDVPQDKVGSGFDVGTLDVGTPAQ